MRQPLKNSIRYLRLLTRACLRPCPETSEQSKTVAVITRKNPVIPRLRSVRNDGVAATRIAAGVFACGMMRISVDTDAPTDSVRAG